MHQLAIDRMDLIGGSFHSLPLGVGGNNCRGFGADEDPKNIRLPRKERIIPPAPRGNRATKGIRT